MTINRKDRGHPRQWLAAALVLLLMIVALPGTARADGPNGPDLNGVEFEQKLNAQVPRDLTFRDERNQAVRLGDYFGKRPVILTLNYLRCQNLCPLELQDLAATLAQLPFNPGEQYDVVTVSIDPRDTPVVAASKRDVVLGLLNRPGADAGWHYLTGDAGTIAALAKTVGFQYRYEPELDDYAHPLGIIVLTPQGQVARYVYGVDFPVRDVRLALVEASQNKIGSPVDQVFLFCYHYDPNAGRYSAAAMNVAQIGAAIGAVILGVFLLMMWRMEREHA